MTRRSYRSSEVSRERILDAATELFAQRGYAGAGVDQLAARSGIAKSAIYYHFGSKEGLLVAASERAATAWIESIQQAVREAGDWQSRLDRALAGMRTLLEEKPWVLKLLQILALEVADEKPEIRASLQSILRQARDAIVSGINDALGVEVPDADGVAMAMLAYLDGIALTHQLDPDAGYLDKAFADLRRTTAFLVSTRLNPALAGWVDEPGAEHPLPEMGGGR